MFVHQTPIRADYYGLIFFSCKDLLLNLLPQSHLKYVQTGSCQTERQNHDWIDQRSDFLWFFGHLCLHLAQIPAYICKLRRVNDRGRAAGYTAGIL